MRTCTTPTKSYHQEETYMPNCSGLIQMRVERSQEGDFIADNEELHGEDFDEDADLSDDDVEAQASGPIEGQKDTTECPDTSVAITSEDECKSAATVLGKNFKTKRFANHPKGCMTRGKMVFYNTHATGKKNPKSKPLCTKLSQAAAQAPEMTTQAPAAIPPPQANCGWTTYALRKCDGQTAGGEIFWDLASAKAKCLELGPQNCRAVTCRPLGPITTCTMRTCTTPTKSYHQEETYMPNCSGLIQMRVQEDDFIADNEELHGEDFDEDADLS